MGGVALEPAATCVCERGARPAPTALLVGRSQGLPHPGTGNCRGWRLRLSVAPRRWPVVPASLGSHSGSPPRWGTRNSRAANTPRAKCKARTRRRPRAGGMVPGCAAAQAKSAPRPAPMYPLDTPSKPTFGRTRLSGSRARARWELGAHPLGDAVRERVPSTSWARGGCLALERFASDCFRHDWVRRLFPISGGHMSETSQPEPGGPIPQPDDPQPSEPDIPPDIPEPVPSPDPSPSPQPPPGTPADPQA